MYIYCFLYGIREHYDLSTSRKLITGFRKYLPSNIIIHQRVLCFLYPACIFDARHRNKRSVNMGAKGEYIIEPLLAFDCYVLT